MLTEIFAQLAQSLVNPTLAREAEKQATLVNVSADQRDHWAFDKLLAYEHATMSEDGARRILGGIATGDTSLDDGGAGVVITAPELEYPLRIGIGRHGDGCYGFFRARLYGEKFERTFMRFAAAPTYRGARELWRGIYAQTAPVPTWSHPGYGVRPPWIAYRALDMRAKHAATPAIEAYGHWLSIAISVVWLRGVKPES